LAVDVGELSPNASQHRLQQGTPVPQQTNYQTQHQTQHKLHGDRWRLMSVNSHQTLLNIGCSVKVAGGRSW
jgi:hypothetical protein